MPFFTFLALVAWTFVFMIKHTLAVPPVPPQEVPNFSMRHNSQLENEIKNHRIFSTGSTEERD